MTRSPSVLFALVLLAGCVRKTERTATPPALRADVPRVDVQVAPPIILDLDVQTILPDAPAEPVDAGGRTLMGPGIRAVILPNRQIELYTTDLWDGGVRQTYENCTFLRNALPSLRRTVSAERYALLVRVCGEVRPGEVAPPAGPAVVRPAPARPAPARPAP